MCLGINIGSFCHFNLVFTQKRKLRNNTNSIRFNSNKAKKLTRQHIYRKQGRGSHIFKIMVDKSEIQKVRKIIKLQETSPKCRERKDEDFYHQTGKCKIDKCDNKTCDKRHPKN